MQANCWAVDRLDVVLVFGAVSVARLAGSVAAVPTHEPTERGHGDAVPSALGFS